MATLRHLFQGASLALVVGTSPVYGQTPPEAPEKTNECGVTSGDYRNISALLVSTGDPYAYCLVGNGDWPLGIESELGLYAGGGDLPGVSVNFARPFEIGLVNISPFVGVHYAPTRDENLIGIVGGEASLTLFELFQPGFLWEAYGDGEEDATVETWFVRGARGAFDYEFQSLSWSSGEEELWATLGWTYGFRAVDIRFGAEWYRSNDDEQDVAISIAGRY